MYQLRDYQQECVDIVNGLADNAKTVVAIATGLGKTVTAAHFKFNKRLLWISHRDELVRQPERYFAEQGYSFGVEKAGEHAGDEDVVSASIQSLSRDARLNAFAPDAFDLIICDEAHHAAAPTYKKVLSYFHGNKLVGLTATPQRGDKVRLDDVFDSICFSKDLKWGIENGYLSRLRCLRVHSSFQMSKLEKVSGDYTAASVARVLKDSDADMVVTKAYLEHCLPEKRQTVIYCPTIEICKIVQQTLVHALPKEEKKKVKILTQQCTPEERRKILDGFREKKYHCIINCMILTEGTDLPEISAIINNRPSANSTLYQQVVGRGTRLAQGKDYCLVIDVVGENSGAREICTAPTLFGLDPELLPPKMREQMEQGDLLEFVNEVMAERAKTAKQLALATELIDFFTQQKLSYIEAGAAQAKTPQELAGTIAEMYRADLEQPLKEYDFEDIIVKREPGDAHYFRIQPTFKGRIYLSNPDMLGKTVMDVDIPECALDFVTDSIPMHEAVQYAKDILQYVVPDYFAMKWSKAARAKLAEQPVTENQERRLYHDYASLFDGRFYTRGLTKLQANDLIDLKCDIQALEKEKASLEKRDEPKRKGTRKYEQWQERQQREEQELAEKTKARKTSWETTKNRLDRAIESGQKRSAAEAKRIAELDDGQAHVLELFIDYRHAGNAAKPPSERQTGFVASLAREAEQRGAAFNVNPLEQGLDMWRFGLLIEYMLRVKDYGAVVPGKKTVYDLKGFIEAIKALDAASRKTQTIPCLFVVKGSEAKLATLPSPTRVSGTRG